MYDNAPIVGIQQDGITDERDFSVSAEITAIEIDIISKVCRVTSGNVHGWFAGDKIERIDVLRQSEILGPAILYDPVWPSGSGAEWQDIKALRTSFDASLSGLILPLSSTIELGLRVQLVGGGVRTADLEAQLPIESATPFKFMPPIRLNLEQADLDDNHILYVSGWAVAISQIITVEISADDEKITIADPTRVREDVGAAHPSYRNARLSGFAAQVRLSKHQAESLGRVKAKVFARDGSTLSMELPVVRSNTIFEIKPSTVAVSTTPQPVAKIFFNCDDIQLARNGRLVIEGWAASAAGISRIAVFHDGEEIGETKPQRQRSDVGRLYSFIPTASQSGFRFSGKLANPGEATQALTLRLETPDGHFETVDLGVAASDIDIQDDDLQEVDGPIIVRVDDLMITNGRAGRPITGSFNLVGWAVARAGVAEVDVYIDEEYIGKAYYGMRREDVEVAFPDWPGTLLSGFALAIPGKLLKDGTRKFRVLSRDLAGETAELSFEVEVKKEAATSGPQVLRKAIPYAEVLAGRRILSAAGYQPMFAFFLNIKKSRKSLARTIGTLKTLAEQCYPNWQVTISIPPEEDLKHWDATIRLSLPEQANRVVVKTFDELTLRLEASGSIQDRPLDVTRHAVIPEGTTMFGLLAAGDELASDALLSVALANVGCEPADFVYGDDRRYEPSSESVKAFFKPDWAPDLLLSQNYLGRCWFASSKLIAKAGLTVDLIRSSGSYEAVLRLTENAKLIRHLPRLLLEQNSKDGDSPAQERAALRAALKRREISADVLSGCSPNIHRVQRKLIRQPKVSIIMPSIGARSLIKVSVSTIRKMTSYPDYEIIIVDNIRGRKLTPEQKAWKVWFRQNADITVPYDGAFNWSKLNNKGANASTGEYLLFLNDDIEILDPNWIQALMEHAQRPEVGVVGPLLLYPDNKIQHAGIFLSRNNIGTARHAFRFAGEDDIGYFGLARTQRNVIGVTGACMLTHRSVFDEVGGFDEAHSVVNNDLDFCLRIHRSGRLIVYTPHTKLIHHELASRAEMKDNHDAKQFLQDWGEIFAKGDPFYNRNLSSDYDDMSFEDEPLRVVHAGYPIGNHDDVRRILAVKLDHIGDMVTALPALRRLKDRFPKARLTALVGRSAVSIARMEPAIDEVIDFEFFEARSGLGYKKLTTKDYAALEDRLHAGRFDLAIDLRKLGDTRHILKHSGASILAGIDSSGQFPWLDYTDEWEGDRPYVNKRNHVSADLINFVDGLANAFEQDRRTIILEAGKDILPLSAGLEAEFAGLFGGTYACVHPASGNAMRQWPPEYFAMLIDLLVKESGISVAILGSPDEAAIAQKVLDQVQNTSGVFNLVGRTRLSDVPGIMSRSALFIGNNSGPQHIAAGLGVATVGVHSGVIASEEWGPLGPDAVALRRDVACGPCYRGKIEDCHRALACLTTLPPHWVFETCQKLLLLRGNIARKGQLSLKVA